MDYILIPSNSKKETAFIKSLMNKMQKETSTFSKSDIEDMLFTKLLKKADKSPVGDINTVKRHLRAVISTK